MLEENDLTETEGRVWKIWAGMLNLSQVERDKSFFELGGDSVGMIDMLFQLNEELGMDIDPSLLFEDATLKGFSQLVDLHRSQGIGSPG